MEKYIVDVPNISCANCKNKIIKALDGLVLEIDVNISTKKVVFLTEDYAAVSKVLSSINYPIDEGNDSNSSKTISLLIGGVGATYFFLQMILVHFLKFDIPLFTNVYVDFIIATLVQFSIGIPYYKGLISDIKFKTFGMDFLVATSTSIAYFYSIYLMLFNSKEMLFFEIQVILLVVIFIGNHIEDIIKKKATKDLDDLLDMQVSKVLLFQGDKIVKKDIEFIKEEDIIQVKLGDKIPLDGTIINGSTSVNESVLSGEEELIEKSEGDLLIAGSINMGQTISIKVTKDYKNSYLSTLINQITDINDNKANIQRIGDKIISIFVPVIFSLSILTFFVWFYISKDISTSLYISLSTLIIACPCSLGLATPISFMIANSKFSKKNLLIRKMDKILNLNKIDTIAFDKTGTLIDKNIKSINKIKDITNEDLSLIKAIERNSNHPLANMIVSFLKDIKDMTLENETIEEKGVGISYENYQIGSHRILNESDISLIDDVSNIFVKKNNELLLEFKLEYSLKDETINFINSINKKLTTIMITGDNKKNSLEVNNILKMDKVYYELKPEDKINILEDLQNNGHHVMYIGDGINDTLALAQADVSIAINGDVEAVKQISDIILIKNNLNNINDLFYISKKVKNNIYQNYLWAFSYNIIAIPLAMMGFLNPLTAGIMMLLSSILVVSNANRLLKI